MRENWCWMVDFWCHRPTHLGTCLGFNLHNLFTPINNFHQFFLSKFQTYKYLIIYLYIWFCKFKNIRKKTLANFNLCNNYVKRKKKSRDIKYCFRPLIWILVLPFPFVSFKDFKLFFIFIFLLGLELFFFISRFGDLFYVLVNGIRSYRLTKLVFIFWGSEKTRFLIRYSSPMGLNCRRNLGLAHQVLAFQIYFFFF